MKKCIKTLMTHKLIKEVKSVVSKFKKIYMKFDLGTSGLCRARGHSLSNQYRVPLVPIGPSSSHRQSFTDSCSCCPPLAVAVDPSIPVPPLVFVALLRRLSNCL